MAAVLRALHDVNYTGPVMPEHAPSVEGDSAYLCAAHDLGYTKALMAQLPSAA
jgi:D-mannonate dehydratase